MGCATLRSFHMSKVGRGLPQSHMAGAWLHTQHGEKGASIDSHSGHSVLCVLDAPHVCGFLMARVLIGTKPIVNLERGFSIIRFSGVDFDPSPRFSSILPRPRFLR